MPGSFGFGRGAVGCVMGASTGPSSSFRRRASAGINDAGANHRWSADCRSKPGSSFESNNSKVKFHSDSCEAART